MTLIETNLLFSYYIYYFLLYRAFNSPLVPPFAIRHAMSMHKQDYSIEKNESNTTTNEVDPVTTYWLMRTRAPLRNSDDGHFAIETSL